MVETAPPDLVRGTYTTDLNINKIHEAVVSRFEYFIKSIPEYEQHLTTLKLVCNDESKSENEVKIIEQEIRKLESIVLDYKEKKSYNQYLNETKYYLDEYNKVASNTSKGIVFFKKVQAKEDESLIKRRLYLIREFLDIAKNYIKLEINHKVNSTIACIGCGKDIHKNTVEEDSGLVVCPSCGYERENISHNSTYKDISRVNLYNRNNYDDCENFRKALLRFQGKQTHKPPAKLYSQLDAYFVKIKKPPGADICKLPLTEDGKKKGTSREMMFEALSETNNSAYYDDINLILHVYWGWILPNITHIEDRIMEDYINTQYIYNSISQKDRNASLNIQFRLFVHLKAIGYSCTKDDFKIQTSRDSLIFHNDMWKIMCEKTGLKFYSVI